MQTGRRVFGAALSVAIGIAGVGLFALAPTAQAAGDTQAPSVAFTSPTTETVSSGTVSVAGRARDNVKVSRVWVKVDSGSYALASGTTRWTKALDTSRYQNGNHTVTVRVRDAAGNLRKRSMSVTFRNGAAAPSSMTAPEGTKIEVNSAGHFTADGIYQMLLRNGLDSEFGPSLTVKVQDSYSSQVSIGTSSSGGQYTGVRMTMYLKGVNSTFSNTPEATLAHELGHAYSMYHLYMSRQGDWSSYLQARGIAGDSRLNGSYEWDPDEIIADDYRLLFGTDLAISQRPKHLNADIADPRNVAGLKEFLANAWSA